MPPKPHIKSRIEERRANIAILSRSGVQVQEIARQLGVSNATVSNDLKEIHAMWREEQIQAIDDAVARQLVELDFLRQECIREKGMKTSVKVKSLIDIQQQEAKLLGLYAPNRTEVSTPEPIQIKWLMSNESNDTDT